MMSVREQWERMEPVEVDYVPAAEVEGDYIHGLWPVPQDGVWRVRGTEDLLSRHCLDCGLRVEVVRLLKTSEGRFYYGWCGSNLHWLGER